MKFFFSYSRSVTKELMPVVDLLRAAGHKVWWDHNIPESSDWWATILDHIELCQVFVFVVSEKSVQSPYCLEEHRYADARNRPILPFIIDDRTRYTIPPEITPFRQQWYEHDGDPARLLGYINGATGQIQLEGYPDYPAPRPPEPNKGSDSLIKQYQQAVQLAENGHFGEAVRHFRNVASLDRRQWGKKCDQWAIRLRLYEEIAELADGEYGELTHPQARKKWADYLKTYDADFDPLDITGKLAKAASPPARSKVAAPGAPTPPRIEVLTRPEPPPAIVKRRSEEFLPAPFAWIDIPGTKGKTRKGAPYKAAKYPLTNDQYRLFIEAGGYNEKRWWTQAGWQQRAANKWTEPYFWHWQDSAEHPVVGVTWFEAVAFCLWLSDITGENIMLPTEDQWQYAAQGDGSRAYPWGEKWDASRCNNTTLFDAFIHGTTPVRQYEGKGDSPFGVVDMSGNAWEWCLTDHGKKTNDVNSDAQYRVLRGGSWYKNFIDPFVLCRCDFRGKDLPGFRAIDVGFRLALS